MAIKAIVAVDPHLAIGRDGGIPWHLPADLRFFKAQTTGHAVVMGRATWDSLARRPLPKRLNIVLSREPRKIEAQDGVIGSGSVGEVVDLAKQRTDGDLFVIGGAQVYAAFGEHVDEWVVTRIPFVAEGADTFMPADFLDGFELHRTEAVDAERGVVAEFYRRRDGRRPAGSGRS